MKKKGFIGLAVAGCITASAFAGLMAGCGGGDSKADFTIWAPTEEQVILPGMIDAFKEAYPEYKDLKFAYREMGVEASIDAIKKDKTVAADIFMFPSGGVTELRKASYINPITLTENEANGMYNDLELMFTKSAAESVTLKEGEYTRILGIPLTLNTFFMYYNTKFYNETEVQSLETMMAKDLGSGVKNFSMPLRDSWYISSFFLSGGNQLYADSDETIECLYNGEYGKKVGEYLIDLRENGRFYDDHGSDAADDYKKSKLAAICTGTWSAKNIEETLGEDYSAAPLPTIKIDGVDRRLSPFGDYKAYGINSYTTTRGTYELANLLVQWLGSATCQAIRYEKSNYVPTHKQIQAQAANASPAAKAAIAQEEFCVTQPKTTKLTYYWDPLEQFGTNLMANSTIVTKGNLQDALNTLVKDIKHEN